MLLEAVKRKTAQKRQQHTLTRDTLQPHLKILNKNNELVPFVPNKAQRHLAERLTGRDIILKARQLGFSTFVRALHETKAMTETCRLATLAHDGDTTSMLRRMSRRYWDNLPDDIRPDRGIDNATTTIYTNTGSEVIIKTAGSKAGGRGGTLSDVHGSEVAFWADASENIASIMQAVPIDGNIILESTPNGAVGWFYEECMKALSGDSVWTLHFYEWWWDDNYRLPLDKGETLTYSEDEQALVDKHGLSPDQIKWRRYKIKEIPHKFAQEYPEDVFNCFLASGNSFFGDTEHVFTAPLAPKHNPDHIYIGGLDFGQDNDYTVLVILDATTYEQVAQLRINQMRWDTMRDRIRLLCEAWKVNMVIAEWNSIGKVNIESLRDLGLPIRAFKTTNKSKPPLIQGLYTGFHEVGLRLQDDSNTRHEIRNFISKQTPSGHWQYEANEGAHDDTVIATALAWHGVMRSNYTIEAV